MRQRLNRVENDSMGTNGEGEEEMKRRRTHVCVPFWHNLTDVVFWAAAPDRGQSPVEWGDFPSVCPFVYLYMRLRGKGTADHMLPLAL